jgi:hypothetical protein
MIGFGEVTCGGGINELVYTIHDKNASDGVFEQGSACQLNKSFWFVCA